MTQIYEVEFASSQDAILQENNTMNQEKQTIEQSLKRLEKIVEELNARDVDVEEGLKKFKEGVELVKICRNRLGEAENEFKKLQAELTVDSNKEYVDNEV